MSHPRGLLPGAGTGTRPPPEPVNQESRPWPPSRSPPSTGVPGGTHDPPHTARPGRRAVYLRRRLVALLLGIALVLVMAQAGAALGGSTLAAPERRPTALDHTIVRPGDSLWSVAQRLAPGDDPRPVVDALAQARHGEPLSAGRDHRVGWVGDRPRADRPRRPGIAGRAAVAAASAIGAHMDRGAASTVAHMRCPFCEADDDKVVDSRPADEGAAVRRRRECLTCGRRFTTYERVDELPLLVVKRSGARRPVRRREGPVRDRARRRRGRRSTPAAVDALAVAVEEAARAKGHEVTSEWIGRAVLEWLRQLDPVSACGSRRSTRASTTSATSSGRSCELQKSTAPKVRGR